MVRLDHTLLALSLTSLSWAYPQPNSQSGNQHVLQRRQRGNDQYVFATCPSESRKCSECGGDSKKAGFCDNEIATGWASDYYYCKKWHDGNCGLVCKCTSDETGEPGTGLPPIIPFPPIPIGFAAPPPAVPNPKKTCPEDFSGTSCKDCEALEGWCTTGENAGCPCRDECPADDAEKPTCSSDDCEGEGGKCTVGHTKGCDCKEEVKCPEFDDGFLGCPEDNCKGDEEDQCTTDKYKGCECFTRTEEIYTWISAAEFTAADTKYTKLINSMNKYYDELPDQEEPDDPEVTCSSNDYSKAINMEYTFIKKLNAKFCEGDDSGSKERSVDLTSKDVDDTSYEGYTFTYKLDPGECELDCGEVFSTLTSSCQGLNSHSMQISADAKIANCGASLSYEIKKPEDDSDDGDDGDDGDDYEDPAIHTQQCHGRDDFGSHGDVRGGDLSISATGCAGQSDEKSMLSEGSDPVEMKHQYGGTKLKFTMSWVEGCKGDTQDARYPFGNAENNVLGNTCWQVFVDDWKKCNNGGAGGFIDYGCVRYDFRPTFD